MRNFRFRRGGNDLLAARGLAAPASPAAAAGSEAPTFRVLAGGIRPVRRGAEWVLKAPGGAMPLSAAEAEAAGWLLARPDVAEAELHGAHPAVDAGALLARLQGAGLLIPAA